MGRTPLGTMMGCLVALVVVMGIKQEAIEAAVPEVLVPESEAGDLQDEPWEDIGYNGVMHANQSLVLDGSMAMMDLSGSPAEDVLRRMEPLLVREPTIRTPMEDFEAARLKEQQAVSEPRRREVENEIDVPREEGEAGGEAYPPKPEVVIDDAVGVPVIEVPVVEGTEAVSMEAGAGKAEAEGEGEGEEKKGEGKGEWEGEEGEGEGEGEVIDASLQEMMKAIGEEEEERRRELEELSKDHLIAQEAERVAEEEKAAKLRAEQEEAAEREKRKERPPMGAGAAFSGLAGMRSGFVGTGRSSGSGAGVTSGAGGRTRVPMSSGYGSSSEMAGMFSAQGQASFESILESQEKSAKSRWGDEEDRPGLRKARMDAKRVLETEALLNSGAFGPKIPDPFADMEGGDKGRGGSDVSASSTGGAQREILRIMREGAREEVNHYNVLGVGKGASHQRIKERFRALVLQVHPDKCAHRDAHEAFQLVQEAYESLASPTERAKYDQFLVKMRAKRWRRRIRPVIDYLDEWSDYTDPLVTHRGRILAAIIMWVVFL